MNKAITRACFVCTLFWGSAFLGFSQNANTEKNINQTSVNDNSKQVMPHGFPVYENTGNSNADALKYDEAKKEWIKNNPGDYAKLNPQSDVEPVANNVTIAPTNKVTNSTKIEIPGFPSYVNTGNKELDDANYTASKEKWISEHKDQYNEMNHLNADLPNNSNQTQIVKTEQITVAFEVLRSYTLVKIEAVPAAGMTPTKDELNAETEKVKVKFPELLTSLDFGKNDLIRLYLNNNVEKNFIAVQSRNLNKVEWLIMNQECSGCSKTLNLEIQKETENSITYIMLEEDENTPISFLLTFNLTNK